MNRVSRRSWTAAAVVVALAAVVLAGPSAAEAAAPAKPAKGGARKGIVQSVSPRAVVLRQLDGSTVRVQVAPSTRVFVDGKRATLHDIRRGFVATATGTASKPARVLQAFNLSGQHAVRVGIVDALSDGVLDVTLSDGGTLSIPVNAKTHVFVDGKRATLAAVKTGYTVVIPANSSKGDKPARELRFLRPR
jgi:endonuclease YncB( thermonuclease family)